MLFRIGNIVLTYRSQQRIEEVFCTTPEVHVGGEMGAEDWDVGDRTGEADGQRTIQSAGKESNIANS